MATFYIQLENKLLQISGELTAENVSKALGYVPVSPNVTNELSQRVDNITFDSLKDNPFLQDGSGELNIVDEAGNIIAKIDVEGIHSVDFIAGEHRLSNKIDKSYVDGALKNAEADLTGYVNNIDFYNIKNNPIIDGEENSLTLVDENSNIGLKVTEDGLYVKDVIADGHTLSQKADKSDIPSLDGYATEGWVVNQKYLTEHQDISHLATKDEIPSIDHLATKDEVSSIDFYNINNNPIVNNGDDKLLFVDENGYIGLQLEENGLYVKDVIADGHTLSQKADKSDIPSLDGYATESYVNTNLLNYATKDEVSDLVDISVVEELQGKVNTLIGEDSDKSVRTIANKELAALLLAGNDNFKSLQELAAWIDEHPEDASAMNEAIQTNTSNITKLDTAYKEADVKVLNDANEYTDNINFYTIKDNPIVNGEAGSLTFVDETGYIGLKVTEEGIIAKDVVTPEHKLSDKANTSDIPTKVSQLQNDANYITTADIPSLDEYVTETELSEKGYLTEHQDISHLAEKSEIPSLDGYATEQWVEDKNYLTEHLDISHLASKEELNSGLLSKQDTLTSGTTIKTINGESILGSGDIVISGNTFDPSDLEDAIETKLDKEEAAATYLPKGNYAVDDVVPDGVYAVDADGKLIDYNLANSTALGVALVAGEYKFMIAKSDATNDGSNYILYWTNNTSDLSLTNYSKVDGTNGSGNLPKPDGTFGGSTHLSDDFTTWTNGALSDFNGKDNTEVIAAASSHENDMCTVLNTFNASDSFKDWYVPACGQLALMYLNMTEINAALAKIGGTALAAENYWSSSEGSSFSAWRVDFYNGDVDDYGSKGGTSRRVRFVRDISVRPLKERVSELESNKQDKLVSGTNIKTINNQSVLGSGNITISGGGSSEPYVLDIPSLVSSFGGLPDDMGNVQCYGTVTSQKMSEIITAANNNNLVIKNEHCQYHNYDIQDRFDEDDEIVDINVNGNPFTNAVGYAPCSEIISISLNVTTSEAYLSCSYSPISGKFILYEDDASFLILIPNTYHIVTDESPTDICVYLLLSVIQHFMEEYFIEFTTSSSGTTVSLPSTIKWADGEIPIFEPSTTYQISIVNNLGVVQKFK